MKKLLGIYPLGHHQCKLFLRDDWGDAGHAVAPDKGVDGEKNPYAEMTVGIDSVNWQGTFSSLLHEAFEFTATMNYHGYDKVAGYHFDTQGRLLVMNHNEFCEVVEQTGYFISFVIDDFRRAWKAHHRKKTKKKT